MIEARDSFRSILWRSSRNKPKRTHPVNLKEVLSRMVLSRTVLLFCSFSLWHRCLEFAYRK